MTNPLIEITVVACSVPHLKGGAMKDFIKIMKVTNRFIAQQWNSSDRKYKFKNGSTIEFVNADGDKAIGPRRDILYVNEANLIEYETYNQLAIRTSQDIYLDFNPVNNFWVHNEVLTEDDSELLILTYRDNEGLPETVLEELLSKRKKALTSDYWTNWCKVYLDGEVGSLEGVIFNNWTTIDKIPEDATIIGYGMDFGYADDPTTLIALYKYNGKIILDEIFNMKGLGTNAIVSLIKQEKCYETIFADSAELRLIDEIKSKGISIRKVKKGPGSVVQGIQIMQEYEYLITNRSKNIKEEFSKYCWLTKGNKTEPCDAFNHTIDAIRYCVWMKLGMKESTGGKEVYTFNF